MPKFEQVDRYENFQNKITVTFYCNAIAKYINQCLGI